MLAKRELDKPDGRHLYQYRLTATEFGELEIFLKQYVSVGQSYLGLSGLAKRSRFPSLFVLYGAEWWRRRYDGSGYSWEGILHDIGANADEWNHLQRSGCVKTGLQAWGLRLEDSRFKFLGSVAIQGGLPMKPLAEARGGIGQLLGRVLRMANNRTVIQEDIQKWIENLQNYLPKSYRQAAIFALLAETAWTVLNLKQKARLDSAKDAISRLDAAIPNWRNQFPLPMEDQQAQLLIEQLVRDAVNVRPRKPSVCLPVERFLESTATEEWRISSNIELPEIIEAQKFASLFEIETDDLPRFAELSVTAGDKTRTAAIRKMAGNGSYRLEGATWDYADKAAWGEHLLRLNSNDGRVWTAAAMKGQSLDDDLPWIFSVENSIFRFVRQGTGGVAGKEVVAAISPNWKISEQSENGWVKIGVLHNPPREIYKITETVFLENENGARCKISVLNVESETEIYEWRGQRWWLDFLNPSVTFKGKPKLFRVDEDGTAVSMTGAINCTAIGAPVSNHWLGPVTLSYQASGELKHKTRMTLLPEEARLSLKFGDTLSGAVVFDGWQASSAVVITPNVSFSQQLEGNSLVLKLSVPPEHLALNRVTVELYWRHTSTPVRLIVPFPSIGTRAFDSFGSEIADGAMLALNQLFGVRVSVLGGDRTRKITLKLKTENDNLNRKYVLQTLPNAISLEVRMTDYLTDLEHLLSLNDSPDAKVKITLKIGGEKSFTLNIARYSTAIERDGAHILIKTGNETTAEQPQADELKVLAVRLEDSKEEPSVLQPDGEALEGKSRWLFAPESREPGAWLIYPDAAAKINFRPTLWAISGEFTPGSELARAFNFADQEERNNALDCLVTQLAEDFADPSWQEISRLAEVVGHLPLTTLDIWRRFAHSARGMAALAFRCGKLPHRFVSRFEKELPFAWETIPFTVWKKAIKQSFEYCRGIFPDEIAKMTFDAHTERRINILAASHGGLSFLLGLASMEFFIEKQRDAQILRTLGEHARQQLFFGENSRLMNLRRLHGEDEWVADTDGLLEKRWSDSKISRYRHSENYGFQNHVIGAPLLLAAESATSESASWLKDPAKIHLLRTFRAFDPEWFDEAYNWTIVRCLADGLLDE